MHQIIQSDLEATLPPLERYDFHPLTLRFIHPEEEDAFIQFRFGVTPVPAVVTLSMMLLCFVYFYIVDDSVAALWAYENVATKVASGLLLAALVLCTAVLLVNYRRRFMTAASSEAMWVLTMVTIQLSCSLTSWVWQSMVCRPYQGFTPRLGFTTLRASTIPYNASSLGTPFEDPCRHTVAAPLFLLGPFIGMPRVIFIFPSLFFGQILMLIVSRFLAHQRYEFFDFDAVTGLTIVAAASLLWLFELHCRHQCIARRKQAVTMQQTVEARERIDRILRCMILPEVFERLVKGEDSVDHEFSTIVLSDIVSFTAWSKVRRAVEVISMVNGLYREFDDCLKERGLDKICTVGDAYMACTGLLRSNPQHAWDGVMFAAAIQHATERMRSNQLAQYGEIHIRVGVHSAMVAGGLIGQSAMAYQIFGDAVNRVHELESASPVDGVLVSHETLTAIEQYDGSVLDVTDQPHQRAAVLKIDNGIRVILPTVGTPTPRPLISRGESNSDDGTHFIFDSEAAGFLARPSTCPVAAPALDDSFKGLLLRANQRQTIVVPSTSETVTTSSPRSDTFAPSDPTDFRHIRTTMFSQPFRFSQKFSLPEVEARYLAFRHGQFLRVFHPPGIALCSFFVGCIAMQLFERNFYASNLITFVSLAVSMGALVGFVRWYSLQPSRTHEIAVARSVYVAVHGIFLIFWIATDFLLPSIFTGDQYYEALVFAILGFFFSSPGLSMIPATAVLACTTGLPLIIKFIIHYGVTDPGFIGVFISIGVLLTFIDAATLRKDEVQLRLQFVDQEMLQIASVAAEEEQNNLTLILSKVAPPFILPDLLRWVTMKDNVIATLYNNAAVMFCSTKAGPHIELGLTVDERRFHLTRIVNAYDVVLASDALYRCCIKVKATGDVLLVVAGLDPNQDNSADHVVLAKLANALVESVSSSVGVSAIAGLHSGCVVAGVTGDESVIYDVFGDTVNTASRVMSTIPVAFNPGNRTAMVFCSEQFVDTCSQQPGREALVFGDPIERDTKGKGKIVVRETSVVTPANLPPCGSQAAPTPQALDEYADWDWSI